MVREAVEGHGHQVRAVGDIDCSVMHLVVAAEVGGLGAVQVGGVGEFGVIDPDVRGAVDDLEKVIRAVPVAVRTVGGIPRGEAVGGVPDGEVAENYIAGAVDAQSCAGNAAVRRGTDDGGVAGNVPNGWTSPAWRPRRAWRSSAGAEGRGARDEPRDGGSAGWLEQCQLEQCQMGAVLPRTTSSGVTTIPLTAAPCSISPTMASTQRLPSSSKSWRMVVSGGTK